MHTIIHGDCLEELKRLDDNSVDAVITDPPYGLSNTKPVQVAEILGRWVNGDVSHVPEKRGGFMGKDWDSFVPPPAAWAECMRVLKPGGHMAVFAGARTQDLMGLSIRLAGFEIRDTLGWVYGSGFPKSMDISKAIDKRREERHEEALKVTRVIAERAKELGISRRDINLKINGADHAGGSAQTWTTIISTGAHKPGVPTVEQWGRLREFLNLNDPGLDAEVWRLNGRKGTPGEAWEKREVVGAGKSGKTYGMGGLRGVETSTGSFDLTTPATPEAQRWDGWGTALKPAIEPIILARKPLDGTVANNVLAHGVGGLNIDACRVGMSDADREAAKVPQPVQHNDGRAVYQMGMGEGRNGATFEPAPAGRFPANVLLDEHAAKEMDKQSGVLKPHGWAAKTRKDQESPSSYAMPAMAGSPHYRDEGGASRYFPVFKSEEETPETKGRFPANVLLDEYAAAEMDEQSGVTVSKAGGRSGTHFSAGNEGVPTPDRPRGGHTDSGGASRFFPVFKYQAKAPKRERPVIEREDGTKIQHPTVKPVALMEWLVSLIVPPGGVVLDPFAGSGTTLQAAVNKGFTPIGIEQDADYIQLIHQRLEGGEQSTRNS